MGSEGKQCIEQVVGKSKPAEKLLSQGSNQARKGLQVLINVDEREVKDVPKGEFTR